MQRSAQASWFGTPSVDRHRLAIGAVFALALHLALLLWGAVARPDALRFIEPLDAVTAIDLQEWQDEPAGSGGEPEAEPDPEPEAQPEPQPKPVVPRSAVRQKVITRRTPTPSAKRFAPPSIERTDEPPRPVAIPGTSRRRQRRGRGFGVGSGAGGLFGNGRTVGSGHGAFRARVCFIPESTRALKTLGACEPVYEAFIDEINVPTRRFEDGFPGFEDRTEWFSVNISGRFRVSEAGTYRFRLKSDDGSLLFVNGHLVVDNDGIHGAVSKRGEIVLDEGVHDLRIRYFQGMKYELALQLFVQPPDAPERLFRAAL